MNPIRSIRFVFATVLVALLGCNSQGQTAWQVSAPETATAHAPAPAEARAAAPLTSDPQRDVEQLREMVFYLASDELEGRGLQTEGINKAADYIRDSFRSSGLRPLPGMKEYFQPFTVNVSTAVGEQTRLSIGDRELGQADDFTPLSVSPEGAFGGPVVFVGYSIAAPEFHYDDFDGIDVKGKVALALRYEPTDEQGKSRFDPDGRSEHAAFTSKARAAAERGAVALLVVNPPGDGTDADALQPIRRVREEDKSPIPVVQITRAVADDMLNFAGAKDLATLQKEIDAAPKPQSFALQQVNVDGQVHLKRDQLHVKNVAGYVPGIGPNKDQYIVIGAHYDHLGRGETGSMSLLGRRAIHNGADDNASGTAALMQIASHVARQPRDRSIVFIAFTAEERGLLGSAHFVNNSPIPLDKIVTMVNLDMVGRMQNNTLEVGGTGTAAEFDAMVKTIDEATPQVRLKPAASRVGGRGGMGPSDHASFAMKKIPVLFLWTGNHIDYHRPTDTADKINYDGLAKVVDVSLRLVDELVHMQPTQYVDAHDRAGPTMGTVRVRLGIMPDYGDESEGLKVGSVLPDTPAAKAGIRDGDLIVQMGEDRITSMTDYMTALNKYKAGDTIKIGVMRNGERVDVEATFAGRRG